MTRGPMSAGISDAALARLQVSSSTLSYSGAARAPHLELSHPNISPSAPIQVAASQVIDPILYSHETREETFLGRPDKATGERTCFSPNRSLAEIKSRPS